MKQQNRDQLFWGILLILCGTFLFVNQLIDVNLDMIFLPALGAIFVAAGLIRDTPGLLIPGGILSGIGWGAFVTDGLLPNLNGNQDGGIFLLIFGLGFLLITVLTALFMEETYWWPVIPGGILATVGVGLFAGGVFLTILTLLGKLWPVILIIIGAGILLKALSRQNKIA